MNQKKVNSIVMGAAIVACIAVMTAFNFSLFVWLGGM